MGEDYSEKRLDALDAMKQRCDFIKTNFPNLYDISLAIYMGACMYHYQCAIRCNATKKNKNIKKNILSRIKYRKTGNVFNAMHDKKQKLYAFAGIGYPKKFFGALDNVVGKKSFPDHYQYTDDDLKKLVAAAARRSAKLITTEKDWVRLPDWAKNEIKYARLDMTVDDAFYQWLWGKV